MSLQPVKHYLQYFASAVMYDEILKNNDEVGKSGKNTPIRVIESKTFGPSRILGSDPSRSREIENRCDSSVLDDVWEFSVKGNKIPRLKILQEKLF